MDKWISEWPSNVVPAGAKTFSAVDYGIAGESCQVTGFVDPETGVMHIQDIAWWDSASKSWRRD